MNKVTLTAIAILSIFVTELAAAVDETSSAYQTGSIAGKVFIAIFVFLIIKKLFFNKS